MKREHKAPQKKTNLDKENEKKARGRELESRLIKSLYGALFESTFSKNPYLNNLDTANAIHSKIPEITTHCAAQLQKKLTGEGQITLNVNSKSFLSELTSRFMAEELKRLE